MSNPSITNDIYKKSLWTVYEHLGRGVLCNLMWALMCLPCFVFTIHYKGLLPPVLFYLIIILLLLPVSFSTMGIYYIARIMLDDEKDQFTLRDFFCGGKLYYKKGFLLILINWLIFSIFKANISFYSNVFNTNLSVQYMIRGFMYWFGLIIILINISALPLCVYENMTIKKLIRNASVLTIKHAGFVALMLLHILLFIMILYFFPLLFASGIFLFTLLVIAVFQHASVNYLVDKYHNEI